MSKPLVKQVMVGVTPEDGFGKAVAAGGVARVIFGLFGKRSERLAPVNALLDRVTAASRQPVLYLEGGIPDTFEGRFESLTLHVFLVLRRLRELPAPAADLAQELVDACFSYLEFGFRQSGISDIAVPKRMKKIGQMFYGRIQAYERALASSDEAELAEALRRNAGCGEGAVALAAYVRQIAQAFAGRDLDAILEQEALFPAFPSRET
jgi:cytochrome b pre-mRNA-processing protein 3